MIEMRLLHKLQPISPKTIIRSDPLSLIPTLHLRIAAEGRLRIHLRIVRRQGIDLGQESVLDIRV
jgi:hypothetical protein